MRLLIFQPLSDGYLLILFSRYLYKSIKFLSLLHKRPINDRSIDRFLPASQQSKPNSKQRSSQLHWKKHHFLFVPITHQSDRNESNWYKSHVKEAYCCQMIQILFRLFGIFAVFELYPRFPYSKQKSNHTNRSKGEHDVSRDRIKHMILIVFPIADFVEHGHDDVE